MIKQIKWKKTNWRKRNMTDKERQTLEESFKEMQKTYDTTLQKLASGQPEKEETINKK